VIRKELLNHLYRIGVENRGAAQFTAVTLSRLAHVPGDRAFLTPADWICVCGNYKSVFLKVFSDPKNDYATPLVLLKVTPEQLFNSHL
jgi:hypothetical protein